MTSTNHPGVYGSITLACLFLLISACNAAATELAYCRVQEPSFTVEGGEVVVSVKLACRPDSQVGFVPYPTEVRLYVGATFYEIIPKSGKPAIIEDSAAPRFDLPAAELSRVSDGIITKLRAPAAENFTHYAVAVWDLKQDCPEHVDRPGCKKYGYVLGRIDIDEMPIPVDTFPRPRCDKEALRALENFDCFGPAPGEFCESSDCVNLQEGTPTGLGYSIFRWNVAPIPSR